MFTEIKVVKPEIPDALLVCDLEPMVPIARGLTDEAMANYVVDLALAGRDCRRKLGEVQQILTRP